MLISLYRPGTLLIGTHEVASVCITNIINRGDDTIPLFAWMDKLRAQAKETGGTMLSILGNHEWMNAIGTTVRIFISPHVLITFHRGLEVIVTRQFEGCKRTHIHLEKICLPIRTQDFRQHFCAPTHDYNRKHWAILGQQLYNGGAPSPAPINRIPQRTLPSLWTPFSERTPS